MSSLGNSNKASFARKRDESLSRDHSILMESSGSLKDNKQPTFHLSTISLQTVSESGDGCMDLDSEQTRNQFDTANMTVKAFLTRVDESYDRLYGQLFEDEQITMEILAEMSNEQLREIGIAAYGARHKILKGVEKFYKQG